MLSLPLDMVSITLVQLSLGSKLMSKSSWQYLPWPRPKHMKIDLEGDMIDRAELFVGDIEIGLPFQVFQSL